MKQKIKSHTVEVVLKMFYSYWKDPLHYDSSDFRNGNAVARKLSV